MSVMVVTLAARDRVASGQFVNSRLISPFPRSAKSRWFLEMLPSDVIPVAARSAA
jgi:hypothetical protein